MKIWTCYYRLYAVFFEEKTEIWQLRYFRSLILYKYQKPIVNYVLMFYFVSSINLVLYMHVC